MRPVRHKRDLRARKLLFALVLGGSAVCAQTADEGEPGDGLGEQPEIPRYAVEIILFRYGENVADGNERFLPDPPPEPLLAPYAESPFPPGRPPTAAGDAAGDAAVPEFGDLPPAADAAPDDLAVDAELLPLEEIVLPTTRVKLTITPREALTLGDVHDKLELLDAYEPVLWTGWTQDAIERELSPAIPLRRLGNAPPQFDGSLTLYLSRFLHLVVDLTLTSRQESPYPPDGTRYADPAAGRPAEASVPAYGDGRNEFGVGGAGSGLVRLRIEEDRIVRNGDLRYFDHPRFGLLAKVTRVEDSDAAAPDEGVDDTDVLLPVER